MTCLSNDDKVGPAVLDPSGVERALMGRNSRVRHGLAEHAAHALAGLYGTKLLDRGRPVRVGEQGAGEDASS